MFARHHGSACCDVQYVGYPWGKAVNHTTTVATGMMKTSSSLQKATANAVHHKIVKQTVISAYKTSPTCRESKLSRKSPSHSPRYIRLKSWV